MAGLTADQAELRRKLVNWSNHPEYKTKSRIMKIMEEIYKR